MTCTSVSISYEDIFKGNDQIHSKRNHQILTVFLTIYKDGKIGNALLDYSSKRNHECGG